jgi:FHS family glucose/mannose:H+ symporter-like MFS transporter
VNNTYDTYLNEEKEYYQMMRKIVWIGCLSYLLIGLAHVVLGTVLEELIAHYDISHNTGSQLIFNQFAGFLIGVLITPWLSRMLSRKGVILLALCSLTAAEAVYSFLPPWGWMLTVAPLAGFGFGIIEAAIGALIIEFVIDNKAVAMSKLEVFFGLGALLMPTVAGILIHNGLWQWSFPFIAFVSFGTLIVWALFPFGKSAKMLDSNFHTPIDSDGKQRRYTRRTLPILIIMMLFFLIYVGMEMSLVHFFPTIIKKVTDASPSTATASLTLFWGTMVIGRIFSGHLAERAGYVKYLIYSCAGSLVFLILFSYMTNLWSSMAMILLLGLLMSGIFAMALILANERIPGMTERTTSLLVASGGIGGALLPRFIGWLIDKYPLQATQWVLICFTALLLIFILIIAFMDNRKTSS